MRFSEIAFQSRMIEADKAERFKNQMICSAFEGWQYLMAQGEKGTFSDYLNNIGLSDKDDKLTAEDKKKIAAKAYETGERVMKMFKGKL
jgi:hypothetical protein